jgi:trans-aconitate methyltransferase
MDSNELDAFYASQYREVYQGEAGVSPQDLLNQEERASALLSFTRNEIPTITRHLDIGSSAGCLLEIFRDQYQNDTVGVEPGDAYRRYAQSKGLTINPDIADLKNDNKSKFDLISMAHVLEHLPDPTRYLISLREQYLHTHGWLLIEVPNLYCHDSFEIAHLTSFSMHTLRQALLRSGFKIIKHQSHGRPRSELLGLYLTVLAKPGVEVDGVRPEKMVAQKRQLGMLRRRVLQKLFPKQAWIR